MTRRYALYAEDGSVSREVTVYDGVGEFQSLPPETGDHLPSASYPDAAPTSGRLVCFVRCNGLAAFVPVLRTRAKNMQER